MSSTPESTQRGIILQAASSTARNDAHLPETTILPALHHVQIEVSRTILIGETSNVPHPSDKHPSESRATPLVQVKPSSQPKVDINDFPPLSLPTLAELMQREACPTPRTPRSPEIVEINPFKDKHHDVPSLFGNGEPTTSENKPKPTHPIIRWLKFISGFRRNN